MGNRDHRRPRLGAALAVLGALHAVPGLAAQCDPGAVNLRGDWGTARFAVEIADDEAERARGLMQRQNLATGSGMLFLYDRPQRVSFWMRNTLIPLDIIFLDPSGTVRRVHSMAQPLDETPIDGGAGIIAVLEVNGGLAGRIGIAEGTVMQHPFFQPLGAAWPCGAD